MLSQSLFFFTIESIGLRFGVDVVLLFVIIWKVKDKAIFILKKWKNQSVFICELRNKHPQIFLKEFVTFEG